MVWRLSAVILSAVTLIVLVALALAWQRDRGEAPSDRRLPGETLERSLEAFPIKRSGVTLHIPVYTSQSLAEPDAGVTQVIVAIHGLGRNAEGYWDYASASIGNANGLLLVAPLFANGEAELEPEQLYWSGSDWAEGDLSESDDRPWQVSSYEALDELTAQLKARFAGLRTIVLAGHSAGGQMVQRYAATSDDPQMRFVVMNPGSYLYFGPERPDDDGGFSVPDPAPDDYDDYKYGLQDLDETSYMAALGAETLRSRYEATRVHYLLGEDDTDGDDPDLDDSEAAMAQGEDRLERGLRFYDHLGFTFGPSIYERHSLTLVPDVGHSAREMFASNEVRAALLDHQDGAASSAMSLIAGQSRLPRLRH
jgi:pimeloyl-ACP methyl ester carboxylesterase